ncbi:MAG: hypothetical protein ACI802_003771, partial [Candidatus Paceibacteria bacterium]
AADAEHVLLMRLPLPLSTLPTTLKENAPDYLVLQRAAVRQQGSVRLRSNTGPV